jgi:DNA-binding transcriptional regulator GbsR (MarR family)
MGLKQHEQAFILHWGEMGSRWGITRATAQIHALLLISEKPLDAQSICELLNIARSNVSTGLRDLQEWGVVRLIHVMGGRKEHFEADKDAWSALAKIADKRIEKEILPTIEALKSIQQNAKGKSAQFSELLAGFIGTLQDGVGFYRRLRSFPVSLVKKLLTAEQRLERLMKGPTKNG